MLRPWLENSKPGKWPWQLVMLAHIVLSLGHLENWRLYALSALVVSSSMVTLSRILRWPRETRYKEIRNIPILSS